MPDLFMIASAEDAIVLRKHIKTIGAVLRQATADSIPDLWGDSKKVAVYIVAHQGGDNIPALQIVGLANWSNEREKYLEIWKMALAHAWRKILDQKIIRPDEDRFPMENVEIWPTMPRGSWGKASSIIQQ
jgi:hypothetical protein